MAINTSTQNGPTARRFARLLAIAGFVGLGLTMPSEAGDKSWNTGNGDWFNPANWTPFGVPGPDDFIYIGNLGGVQNSTVMLGPPGAGYDLIQITDGMTLDMNGGELVSFDLVSITGTDSTLIARPAPGGER